MKEDIVNPKRYTQNKLECWDFWIKAGLDPLIASAVKYVWRYKYKNGLQDLEKAKVFLKKAIEESQKGNIHYSNKYYFLTPGEVEDFSNKQFRFVVVASHTTGKTHYVSNCKMMLDLLDIMIDKFKKEEQ